MSATSPLAFRLLPGSHSISSLGGNSYFFTITDGGLIGSVAAPAGVFSGAGTTALTAQGRQVTFHYLPQQVCVHPVVGVSQTIAQIRHPLPVDLRLLTLEMLGKAAY